METTEPLNMEDATAALLQTETPETPEVEDQAEPDVDEDAPVEEEQTLDDDDSEDAPDEGEDPGEEPETDEEGEEDETSQEQTFTVKVDGQDVSVSLSELTRSYSGQKYIQKGMQEAAEARKQAETAFQDLQAKGEQLNAALQQVQQGVLPEPKLPDPALAETDPMAYLQADAKYQNDLRQYQMQQQHIAQAQAQAQEATKEARAAYVAEQSEKLKALIPELGDAEKAPKIYAGIRAVATDVYGFTEQELGGVTDARHVQVLNDARQWRELQASKAQVTQQAQKKARKVVKPGAKRTTDPNAARIAKAQQRLQSSGSIDDAVALIMKPE